MTCSYLNGKQFINTKNDYYYVNTLEINIRIILQPINSFNWIGNDSELPIYRLQKYKLYHKQLQYKESRNKNYEAYFLHY